MAKTKSASTAVDNVNHVLSPAYTYTLQFDGGSKGNPGKGGSGSCLFDHDGREVWNKYTYIGDFVTNNVAEYSGLIEGLKYIIERNIDCVRIEGDSQLIVKQINGEYQVKNEQLKICHKETMSLLAKIKTYSINWIPRDRNARADELSNIAMIHSISGSESTAAQIGEEIECRDEKECVSYVQGLLPIASTYSNDTQTVAPPFKNSKKEKESKLYRQILADTIKDIDETIDRLQDRNRFLKKLLDELNDKV